MPSHIVFRRRPPFEVRFVVFAASVVLLEISLRLISLFVAFDTAWIVASYISIALIGYRIFRIELVFSAGEITLKDPHRTITVHRDDVLTIQTRVLIGSRLCCLAVKTTAGKRLCSTASIGSKTFVDQLVCHVNQPEAGDPLLDIVLSKGSALRACYRWMTQRISALAVSTSLLLTRCSSVLWSRIRRVSRRAWRELDPRRLARMYAVMAIMIVALGVGIRLVPQPDVAPITNPSVDEIDVAVDHPGVGMYVGVFDYYNSSYLAKAESEVGPFPTLEVLVALDIKSVEKVRWIVTFDNNLDNALPSESVSLRAMNSSSYPTSQGVSVHNDVTGVSIVGAVQGPVDGTAVLSNGAFGIGSHILNPQGVSSLSSLSDASLVGNIPGLVAARGAAISVAMPTVFPETGSGIDGLTSLFSPSSLATEEDVEVGPYSVQTGNAVMDGVGVWGWFDSSGSVLVAQATGIDPSIQSDQARESLYAGIAFGVAGSAVFALIHEYRRPGEDESMPVPKGQ